MTTFIIGLIILIAGGALYGRVCERVIKPTDRTTPAISREDGVDFVPMKGWKNSLVELLNIAGTGPIFGPIQGILFGPIAFLTIPIGCVIAGGVHDYMVAMISIRNDGEQMPSLVKRFLGEYFYRIYNVFVILTLLLVGVVFIYTPGDLFITQILKQDAGLANPAVWIVYGCIFLYYIIATMFPIDKIIGKIYPVFGAILILSAVGVFVGMFIKGYPLTELWSMGDAGYHPLEQHYIPIFFVTVACGIVSGFHSTQCTIISRTVTHEKEGRNTFYNMMIVEGFIAMVWAAAAMGVYNLGIADAKDLSSATPVVGKVALDLLGSVGGMVAIIGVIILPITSGDTALRSIRIMLADAMHIKQDKAYSRLMLSVFIFAAAAGILLFAKVDTDGFQMLWRYFAWANQTLAVFAFAVITVYMIKQKMPYIMALVPGVFYMFIIAAFLSNSRIGFRLSWQVSYGIGIAFAIVYCAVLIWWGRKNSDKI